ncbi:MAG: quinolinate synthase NadA [Bacteroidetes bacterium]|nr:quinolinate synthase NadA [Bacteroidota bacterium]
MEPDINSTRIFAEKFLALKKEKKAVLLAHFYQVPEIQDIADYVGDSLGLSQQARQTEAEVIVFAGVHFMAETAKILNPEKKVLIPDMGAGCSLADSCPPETFKKFVDAHPGHVSISYINCSAAIKAMSDVICTSSNAVSIVESFPAEQPIIFAPDKNLGAWVNQVTGRNMVLWEGSCEVHEILTTESIIKLKIEHPEAQLIAHPECKAPVLALADFIGSTTALLDYTSRSKATAFIVATETGILHRMKKNNPEKNFYIVPADENCACNDCPYMKMNTIQKLYLCLKNERPEILMDTELISKAAKPILKMLEISERIKLIK